MEASPGLASAAYAVTLTRVEHAGHVYATLAADPHPQWILVNHTRLALAYGQVLSGRLPGRISPVFVAPC